MVATIAKLTDPAAAASYYEPGADDYYTGDDRTPSRWHGRAARKLRLDGEVDPQTFRTLLEGKMTDGTVLGTVRDGAREHTLGWDVTFSAPKSVSTMALVAGDRRLLDAHDRAVVVALDYAERHAAVTRIREGGSKPEPTATGNLAAALFPHYTARPVPDQLPDPQVHTHAVVLNATRHDGEWRSLDSRPLYKLKMDMGAVYRQALAIEAQQLGYAVTITKKAHFEIDGVPDAVTAAFSKRSDQIVAKLTEEGKTRATASAAHKNVIAIDTRATKEAVDHRDLALAWRERATTLGFDGPTRRRMVAEAEARTVAQPSLSTRQRMPAADRAVALATAAISERQATFSAASVEREAGDAAQGRATHADIRAAIARAERRQSLVVRAAPHAPRGVVGFATREGVEAERTMLRIEAEGREQFKGKPFLNRVDVSKLITAIELAPKGQGHAWNEGQLEATRALLLSEAAVTGIQGSAGTAKTTTVLKTFADAARKQGFTVRALAPTATAADVLARAIEAKPMTVAMMLDRADDEQPAKRIDIIDEASMLSARDAARVLAHAQRTGTRLVLVGDVAQLGSVEAGRSFGQLQQAGMPTFKLEKIVRQTNTQTREAVEAMLAGDAKAAFAALDAGGGAVIEQRDDQTRIAFLARDFAKLSPEERAGTLVLDPTREGRRNLTDAIRLALLREGQLGDEALVATVLEPQGLTRAEAAQARSYTPGDIVTFRKSTKGKPRPGVGYRVEAVDAQAGTVRLVPPNPKAKTHDWKPARWGSAYAEAFAEVEQEFRTGDKVQFTRNNYSAERLNGSTAIVVAVDPQGSSVLVEKDDGERQMLDLRHLADRHVRPGWVRTIHSSQGATCDRVMAHLESFRANTVDTRAAYVAISRARKGAAIYTDSRAKLTEELGLRDGAQVGAIDETMGLGSSLDSNMQTGI